jgi:hypothetical protein
MARSQPSPNDGRGPLGRTIASDASVRRDVTAQRPLSSFISWLGEHPSLTENARRNRRAPGASAGGKVGCDERSRSELTGFLPAVGDRQIADCSAVNPRYRLTVSVGSSLRYLRYLRDLRANCDGARPSCLRAFVFATSSVFLSVSSVPLWFNTWGGGRGDGGGCLQIGRELR